MTLRINLDRMMLAIYMIVMMLGNFMSSPIVSLLHHGFAVLAVFMLVFRKYMPSEFVLSMGLYTLLVLVITFFANDFSISIYTVINYVKIVLFLAVVDSNMKLWKTRTVDILYHTVFLLCLMNTVLMYLFPRGVIQADVEINQWTTVQRAVWPLGNVNSMIGWYLLLLLLIIWRNTYKKLGSVKMLTTVGVALLAIMKSASSTSLVVLIIAMYAVWLSCFQGHKPVRDIKINTLYVIFIAANVLLVAGQMSFLNPILERFFGKDATFSMRTDIWTNVLVYIAARPLFGWGYMTGASTADLLGNVVFTSAHNQVLHTLWQSGIVGLAVLVVLFVRMGSRISKVGDTRVRYAISLLVFALLVELMFETALSRFEVWTYVMLCSAFSEYCLNRKMVRRSLSIGRR